MTMTYTGMNPDGTGTLSDADHVWNAVRDILLTPLASRVMRREYGSLVCDITDEPMNDVTRLQCMSAAVIALTQWEPRIALSNIDVQWSAAGKATITLTGTLMQSMSAVQTVITTGTKDDDTETLPRGFYLVEADTSESGTPQIYLDPGNDRRFWIAGVEDNQ